MLLGRMTLRSYHCLFDDGVHVRVALEEVERFRDYWMEAMPSIRLFSDRISRCFWFDLLVLDQRYKVGVHPVLQPLLDLEAGEPPNGTKPATPFTRRPLKGLWHKHWFCTRFLAANLLTVAQRKESMDWIWGVAKEGDIVTDDMIRQIAHRITVQAYEDRHAAKKITGEWIIYLPRSGLNHYLCLGTHLTSDERLEKKIRTLCVVDFPDIGRWVDEAAAAL